MKFITLEPKEFTKFAKKHPDKSFLQTEEIAKLREKKGWTAYYFGVEEKGKIIAATMAVAKPTFLGKSTFYIPGGPLLDYENTQLVNFFFKNLKNYAKSHNGYLIHIEPYYEKIQRDIDGKIVKDGFNHQKAVKNLQNLGFKPTTSDNPKYLFVLDLKPRQKDKLFASFKQNTRNLINRAPKKGIKIRELKKEELPLFKKITESTSERRHFTDKTLDYYQTMYDLFAKKGQIKYIVAEIRSKESEKDISKHCAGSDSHFDNDSRSESEVASSASCRTNRCENDDREPSTLRNTFSDSITPIAAAMFILYGDEIIYLFSGSKAKYMKEYNAQYAIQWHMIQYALEHKFKKYNFFGIQSLPDSKKPGYGVYKFKKGFTTPENGRVVELLGAYELPVSKLYYLHQLLTNIRGIIKK